MKYRYVEGSDGVDNTFEICEGDGVLAKIHFWDAREQAEADAKLIVDALNAYEPPTGKPPILDAIKQIVREHDKSVSLPEIKDYGSKTGIDSDAHERLMSATPKLLEALNAGQSKSWVHNAAITQDIEALRRIALEQAAWWNNVAVPLIESLSEAA